MTLSIAPTASTTYEVVAATLRDAVAQFPAGDEVGKCSWSIDVSAEGVTRSGKPRNLLVSATITIRMPVWNGRDTARAVEIAEWDRFIAALQAHEDGHDTRARDGIQRLHDRIEDGAARRLEELFEAEKARIQRVSDAYDAATRHGRRPPPGTVITFPP